MPTQQTSPTETPVPAREAALTLLHAGLVRPLEEMNADETTDHVIRVRRDFSDAADSTPALQAPAPLNLAGVPADQHASHIAAYQEALAAAQRDHEARERSRAVSHELENQAQALILDALGRDYPQWNRAQLLEIWSEAWDRGHSAGYHEVVLIFGRVADFAARLVKAGVAGGAQ